MSTLAIIPARGGSKGIPRKNVRPLLGRPLLEWAVDAALAAALVDRLVVSTDDAEIAAVARAAGAEVVMRPPELAGDVASSESALLHVLEVLERTEGYRPDVVAFLQCTAPLTTAADIDGTVRLVRDEGYDSAVTMTPFHYFVWRDEADGRMTGVNHLATRRLMRQEREAQYLEVGAVYAMRADGLRHYQYRFFGRIGRHLIPSNRAVEIDEPPDWPLVEALLRATQVSQPPSPLTARLRKIRAVVTDFDGVLTDNRVLVSQDGTEAVTCNRGDGWGIGLLKRAGYLVACISTEENPVVTARCQKLDIPCWQAERDKLLALERFLVSHGLQPDECLYVGNDTNDSGCLRCAGVAVVPRDAAPEAKALADWETAAAGGEGVLREIARLLTGESDGRGSG